MVRKIDNAFLSTRRIWIAEEQPDPDIMHLECLICDFGVNGNGVRLARENAEERVKSLIGKPAVGRLVLRATGKQDFTGHNAHAVKKKDKDGTEYVDVVFDTDALGYFTDARIEDIDGTECIVASANIWRRFEDACDVIQRRVNDGTLSTSWEIAINECHMAIEGGNAVKVVTDYDFLGHCFLGADTPPAYKSSHVLSVAENSMDADAELANALIASCTEITNKGETEMPNENETIVEVVEAEVAQPEVPAEVAQTEEPTEEVAEVVEPVAPAEVTEAEQPVVEQPVVEESSLTDNDLFRHVMWAIAQYQHREYVWVDMLFPLENVAYAKDEECKNELDYVAYTYEVNEAGDVTIVDATSITLVATVREMNKQIASLNSTIASLNQTVQELQSTVNELEPYRAEHDAAVAEQEKARHEADVAEMRQYVLDSCVFSETECAEMSDLIENLDRAAIDARIASRVVENVRNNKGTEHAVAEQVQVVLDVPEVNLAEQVRKFIKRS